MLTNFPIWPYRCRQVLTLKLIYSIGGNQRELARAKNAKKQEELAKKKAKDAGNAGSRLTSRQERSV